MPFISPKCCIVSWFARRAITHSVCTCATNTMMLPPPNYRMLRHRHHNVCCAPLSLLCLRIGLRALLPLSTVRCSQHGSPYSSQGCVVLSVNSRDMFIMSERWRGIEQEPQPQYGDTTLESETGYLEGDGRALAVEFRFVYVL